MQSCGRTCVCCSAVRSGICVVVGRLMRARSVHCCHGSGGWRSLGLTWVHQRAIRLNWVRVSSDLAGASASLPTWCSIHTRFDMRIDIVCRRRVLRRAGALAASVHGCSWVSCPVCACPASVWHLPRVVMFPAVVDSLRVLGWPARCSVVAALRWFYCRPFSECGWLPLRWQPPLVWFSCPVSAPAAGGCSFGVY